MKTRTLHIRLPEDLVAWLESQAEYHGLTLTAELRTIATRQMREWQRPTESQDNRSRERDARERAQSQEEK